MNATKIAIITIIILILLALVTTVTMSMKPQMHKTIMLEKIIFKRSK